MIQELLVMAACLEGKGCSQTTTAYYISNPNTKQMIQRANTRVKEAVGPETLAISSPLIFAVRGTGTFKLTNYWSLQLSTKDSNMVIVRVNF